MKHYPKPSAVRTVSRANDCGSTDVAQISAKPESALEATLRRVQVSTARVHSAADALHQLGDRGYGEAGDDGNEIVATSEAGLVGQVVQALNGLDAAIDRLGRGADRVSTLA